MSALERTFTALALAMTLAPIGGTELAAASLDPRTLASVPVRYSAGDEVVIQASIVPEAGERLAPLDLKPGAGLAAQGEEADPELRELTLSKTSDGWLLALRFVPWSPGAGTIPEMRLKGVRIPALHYAAVSLIGPDDRDPSPPRSQRSPPGIALYLYGFAGLLIALALGFAGAMIYLVPAARSLLARRRAGLAFKRLEKSLDYLVEGAESADPSPFFAALSRALRLYLTVRVLPEASTLTAAELASLPETAFPASATRGRAAALIARADRVRYGGEVLISRKDLAIFQSSVEEARAIGAENEEALLARL